MSGYSVDSVVCSAKISPGKPYSIVHTAHIPPQTQTCLYDHPEIQHMSFTITFSLDAKNNISSK